jgi:hypothetical protein
MGCDLASKDLCIIDDEGFKVEGWQFFDLVE